MRYLGIMFSVICFICSISLVSARYYDYDLDGDGVPDSEDMDDDNDGIIDEEDNDDDNDGILDSEDSDDDNDGIDDDEENDYDDDGIPDDEENDDDNDGVIPDYGDNDDDNDGIPDSVDEDDDNDGIFDDEDIDCDNDGVPDSVDSDDDNDGFPDDEYIDDDNDGIPNSVDIDDDNDGILDCDDDDKYGIMDIPDSVEYNYEEYYDDLDYDGISDDEDMDDDNDGIPDEEDLDDDNDGVPDVVVDVSDAKEVPDEGLPAPPTVQACCPPGSRLRLKSMKSGGYSSQCVNTTSKADVGEEVPQLVIVGNTLPQCGRGMQAELLGIKTRETVRAVTTSKPVVVEEVYEEEQFSVEIFSSQIPYGWRLASVSDVRDSSGYVKSAVKSAIASWEYGIACLANDARLLGRGYSHRIEENDTCDGPDDHIGHKVIVKGGRTNQVPRQTTEAPPPAKEYGATLSSSGQLLTADNTFEMEAFCVETTWDEWDSSAWVYNEHSEGGEALALSCDLCKEEVLCHYAKMFYDTYSMDRGSRAETKTVKALIGEFTNFDEFKKAVETFVKDFWKLVDSDEDGNLGEILKQTEVRISSSFLLKLSKFLFEKFDIDWDDELSALDWFELTGETEGDKNIGRKLISLPSPIYTMYTRLDEDRNEVLSLEELNTFLSRTFAMVDKDEDCLIDMKDVIATLDESELPKDYQLGLKQIVQQQLTVANHAFNRIFEVADKNHDNITEAEEILNFNDFDFLDSELEDTLILSQPNMQVVHYLTGEERDTDTWLETLQNLMMNQAYQLQGKYIKCG